jgi:ribosomal protein S18 acetylase RimI-like enzyme
MSAPPSPAAFRVRAGGARDLPLLREMLVEAAYWRAEAPRPPAAEALARPELAKLLAGWGRAGDAAVVAECEERGPLGAAWYRLWSDDDHSYGFVDARTPELAIGVRATARGQGVGAALLGALVETARRGRLARISLSVEPDNPALRLYRRFGFRRVGRVGGAWTLLLELDPPDRAR